MNVDCNISGLCGVRWDQPCCFETTLVHPDSRVVIHDRRGCRYEKLSCRCRRQPFQTLRFQHHFNSLGPGARGRFFVLELGVHDHPEDLDVVSGPDSVPFDYVGLRVRLACFAGEVDHGCLLGLERYSIPLFLAQGVVGDGLYSIAFVLSRRADDPGCDVVHKGDRTPIAVDQSLDQVSIEKEEQEGGPRRSLQQTSLG